MVLLVDEVEEPQKAYPQWSSLVAPEFPWVSFAREGEWLEMSLARARLQVQPLVQSLAVAWFPWQALSA